MNSNKKYRIKMFKDDTMSVVKEKLALIYSFHDPEEGQKLFIATTNC